MIENIRLSFQGIWAHKMRSFLTMLGIIIGIASIISSVSTINGTNEQIKRNLIGAGNNVVRVQLYQNDTDWVYEVTSYGMPQGIPQVDEDTYLDELAVEIDQWIIDAIKAIGLDTAKAVLNAPREMLVEKADLEEETVDNVLKVLRAEFE